MSKSKGLWSAGFNGVWQRDSLISQMLHLCEDSRMLVTMFDDPALGTMTDHSSKRHNGTIGNMVTANRAYMGLGSTYDLSDGDNQLTFADHADHSFGDGSNDYAMTVGCFFNFGLSASTRMLLAKYNPTLDDREWFLDIASNYTQLIILDNSSKRSHRVQSSVLTAGYKWIVATYDGVGGANAYTGLNFYVNGVLDNDVKSTTDAGYVAMENHAPGVTVGNSRDGVNWVYPFTDKIGLTLLDGSAWSQRKVTESYRLIKQAYGL